MKNKELYSFKGSCTLLGSCCHNNKNRVIDTMCDCNDGHKKMLGKYLKCLMATILVSLGYHSTQIASTNYMRMKMWNFLNRIWAGICY